MRMFTLTFPHLMFSSSFTYHLLPILQDCTVYETENKILHVVSFCFKMSDLYLNINCDSTHLPSLDTSHTSLQSIMFKITEVMTFCAKYLIIFSEKVK